MKYKRGIELNQSGISVDETLGGLAQWYELVACCPKCQHVAAIDRYMLARRFGKSVRVAGLGARLRCTKCGNEVANRVMLVVKSRD
jgi:hypothetical protein